MKKTNVFLVAILILIILQINALGEGGIPVSADYGVRINSLAGQVEIRHSENSAVWNHAASGMELLASDNLRIRGKGYAVISFGEISTLAAKDMTDFILNSKPGRFYQLTLSGGTLMADVYNPLSETTMEIMMSHAVVKTRKAKFIVESSDAASTIKVIEGSVSFTSKANSKVVQVVDGQFARADGLGAGAPQRIDLVIDRLELTHYKAIASQNPVKLNQSKAISSSGIKWNIPDIPFLWYLIPLLIFLLVLSLIIFKRRKKKTATFQKPAVQKVIPSPKGHLCNNCGSSLPEGARFCTNCGEVIQQVQPRKEVVPMCSKCGAVIHSGEKFCTNCGTPVNGSSSASRVNSENSSLKSPLSESQNNAQGKKGGKFLIITLSLILVVGLALAGLYFLGSYEPSLSASRASLFEDEKYDPVKINTAATEVETIFAASDTAGLARIMSPTTLELRRQYFSELAPHMPSFARDFKTRKLLYATPRLAVFEFTSPEGKFTVDFCLGEGGKWMLMRF